MTGRVLRLRRDTAAVMAAVAPLEGEPYFITDTDDFGVGNGAAFGTDTGLLFSKQSHAHNATAIVFTPVGTLRSTTAAAALAALAGRLPQVIARTTATPPVSPAVGDNYIVPASGATGAWVGHDNEIATCSALTPSWVFTVPAAGQYVVCDEDQTLWRYTGSAWKAAGLTLYLGGEITPTQLSADANDYAPTGIGAATILRMSSNASRTVTGITAGTAGRVLALLNVGTNDIVLADASASSTAANRFSFGASITLKAGESAVVWYDTTQSRWALLARSYVVITELPADIALPGDIIPAQITSNQNDYNPTGLSAASTLMVNADAARSITGLQGGRRGRRINFFNTLTNVITLVAASASSSAANRFAMTADVQLGQYQSASFRYDSTSSRWMLLAQTAGASVADGSVGANTLSSDALGLRRKILAAPADALAFNGVVINGDHIVSQENIDTAVTSIGSAGGINTYITDQYSIRAKGTLRVSGARVTSLSLPGYKYALRCTITTTQSSLGTGDLLAIETPIEGLRVTRLGFGAAGASPVSRGVWLRSSVSGSFGLYITNSARDRSYFKMIALTANTWTWCNFENTAGVGQTAFAGDTSGTWLTTTGVGMRLGVALAVGTTLQGTADTWTASEVIASGANLNLAATSSATFDITGDFAVPGLELPPSANAAFLMQPFDQVHRVAERYYWKTFEHDTVPAQNVGLNTGEYEWSIDNGASGTNRFAVAFPGVMRAAPTYVFYNPAAANANVRDVSGTLDCGTAGLIANSTKRMRFNVTAHASSVFSNVAAVHFIATSRMV